jgi:hypothetical protein
MKHFRQIFLHIGPHKTGTSAIQRMADENRATLIRHGILYPSGRWHGQLGSCFARNKVAYVYNRHAGLTDLAAINRSDVAYETRLLQELEESDCEDLVFSYEGFIDLRPDEVGELAKFLKDRCNDLSVIAYCRHPLSFAPSEISQRVRMGLPSGRDDIENPPIPRFKSYFEKFANILGAESVILSDFSKAALHRNDVRWDFLNKIGFLDSNGEEISLSEAPTNESLSAEAVAIAVEMAKSAPGLTQNNVFFRRYNPFLSLIRGVPIRLSEDERTLIMSASRPHLEYLRDTFGMELQEPEEKLSGEVELFGKKAIASLAHELRRLIDEDAQATER